MLRTNQTIHLAAALVAALALSCKGSGVDRGGAENPPPQQPPSSTSGTELPDEAEGPAPDCNDDLDCRCGKLGAEACGTDSSCVLVEAMPLRPAKGCWGEREVVGCRSADVMCAQALTFAMDDDERCWLFESACVSPGFEPSPEATGKCAERGEKPCEQPSE